jgi:hypothetical protein
MTKAASESQLNLLYRVILWQSLQEQDSFCHVSFGPTRNSEIERTHDVKNFNKFGPETMNILIKNI